MVLRFVWERKKQKFFHFHSDPIFFEIFLKFYLEERKKVEEKFSRNVQKEWDVGKREKTETFFLFKYFSLVFNELDSS